MRTKRTVQRKRQINRLPVRSKLGAAPMAPDLPVCVSCGEPLLHLPRYLGSRSDPRHGFQCQRCFYANSTAAPVGGDVIASDRARWLSEVLTSPGSGGPAPREVRD